MQGAVRGLFKRFIVTEKESAIELTLRRISGIGEKITIRLDQISYVCEGSRGGEINVALKDGTSIEAYGNYEHLSNLLKGTS